MKLSLNWLESYFVTKPDWAMVWDKLTMAGIEVEGIEPIAPPFSGIVVGEVVECVPHPDADKLNLCKVNVGDGELLQIICGARNVTAGVRVPCAKVGAVLPDGLHIAERKMRGLTSFGMLCSGNEIACPDGVDGLLLLAKDAPIGTSVRDYLELDDQIVEFKITPNRGDCLSILGLLREISVLTGYAFKPFENNILVPQLSDQIQVAMDAPVACPNYMALVIRGVDNSKILPEYIVKRLTRSNLRSISPIVDITNYVMLELGQPLHAFNLAKVGKQIQVRMAHDNESIKLLDGKVANLTSSTLLICNEQSQPLAIAGVMGGFDSGVIDTTTDLVLESAFFTPEIISGKAKYYGVNSDAAYRYERGVDRELQQRALVYAAALVTHYCGGKVGIISHIQGDKLLAPEISLAYEEIRRFIGCEIPSSTINTILQNLGFKVICNGEIINVMPPSYRFDIAIKEDIIEEVARVYGYDSIPPIMPVASYAIDNMDKMSQHISAIKNSLVVRGYNEIIGYAFVEDKYEQILGKCNIATVKLQNPIAGLNVMRTSLIVDLVKSLISNLNRGHKNIKLFEVGRVFHGEDINSQPLLVSGLVSGNYMPVGWSSEDRLADFFDVKQDVSILLGAIAPDVTYSAIANNPVFHSGRCAEIRYGSKVIGVIGQLHPKLGQQLDLIQLPYLFELDLQVLCSVKPVKVNEVSHFQKVERDLAFLVMPNVVVGEVLAAIQESQIAYLVGIRVFDIYEGIKDSIEPEIVLKSIAIRFVFHANKTLVENEINNSITKIVEVMAKNFNAKLRQ